MKWSLISTRSMFIYAKSGSGQILLVMYVARAVASSPPRMPQLAPRRKVVGSTQRRRLVFTDHALSEMESRDIGRRDVYLAVENHDKRYPGSHKTRATVVKVGTASNGERLCVVLDAKKEKVVVTAYWAK